MRRLAFIVSHPIQYYVPLYKRLAQRDDLQIKVFFTWHAGHTEISDHGFKKLVAWDIPLTDGYDFEVVPNTARTPGTHHFAGMKNPELVERVMAWQPEAVHLTGYAFASHVAAMRAFHRNRVPLLFRGDSHLLDGASGWKWIAKQFFLRQIFRWPEAFLYVGKANFEYYRALDVPEYKLHHCPHSIDVERFAEPHEKLEARAAEWRTELGITAEQRVLLFAGKFEEKKRPVALMQAVGKMNDPNLVLVMVGSGELDSEVRQWAASQPERFRILPFQNQSVMPIVYRLGDIVVLPSSRSETWGLAVNEALACGRPALVSDRVGCAADLIDPTVNGDTFPFNDWDAFRSKLRRLLQEDWLQRRETLRMHAARFSIAATEMSMCAALSALTEKA